MTTAEYINRLGEIATTLSELASRIKEDSIHSFYDINPIDLEQAQYLIKDLQAYNALQVDHRGSFIDIDKARIINKHYIDKFITGGTNGRLPLLPNQLWYVDAERLKLLSSYSTASGEPAKTVRIYPGIVTKAEDDSMDANAERLTFIFTAVDTMDQPIRDGDLSKSVRDQIDKLQPPTTNKLPTDDKSTLKDSPRYDALEEIGTCKSPPPCPKL